MDWRLNIAAGFWGSQAEISKLASDLLTLHGRMGLSRESYMHGFRVEDERRLILEEKYVEVDFLRKLSEKTTMGLDLGYAFERRMFEAQTVLSPIGPVKLINEDIYGGFRMEYLF